MRRDFDYDSSVEGESVRIFVPHHASNKGRHCGQSWEMPVVYTLEVVVDRDIYERLKDGNALLGVSYTNTRVPTQRPLARAHIGRICGITYPGSSYPLPWFVLGSRPADGLMADHINGNGLDNRLQNLRWATHEQNMQNRPSWNKYSSHPGISFKKDTGKWDVCVHRSFESLEEAEAFSEAVHDSVFGQYARKPKRAGVISK